RLVDAQEKSANQVLLLSAASSSSVRSIIGMAKAAGLRRWRRGGAGHGRSHRTSLMQPQLAAFPDHQPALARAHFAPCPFYERRLSRSTLPHRSAWPELAWGFSCQVIFGALFRPDLAAPRPRSAQRRGWEATRSAHFSASMAGMASSGPSRE